MRNILYAFVAILIVLCIVGWMRPHRVSSVRTVKDTIVIIDTVRDSFPVYTLVRFDHWDTIYIPLYRDSITVDSVLIPVPIPMERKEYLTDDYRAVVGGYKPVLVSMEIFRRTKTVKVKEQSKRWGIGPQVGFGVPGGWYVGVGVSYDIWQW